MNYKRVVFRGIVCDVLGTFNAHLIDKDDDSPIIPCYGLSRQGDYSEDTLYQVIIAPIFECSHLPASLDFTTTDWYNGVMRGWGRR